MRFQDCTKTSKYSIPTISSLIGLDSVIIRKILFENKRATKMDSKVRMQKNKMRKLTPYHIQYIKEYFKWHREKYFTVRKI